MAAHFRRRTQAWYCWSELLAAGNPQNRGPRLVFRVSCVRGVPQSDVLPRHGAPPHPAGASEHPEVRYFHIREHEELDEKLLKPGSLRSCEAGCPSGSPRNAQLLAHAIQDEVGCVRFAKRPESVRGLSAHEQA